MPNMYTLIHDEKQYWSVCQTFGDYFNDWRYILPVRKFYITTMITASLVSWRSDGPDLSWVDTWDYVLGLAQRG